MNPVSMRARLTTPVGLPVLKRLTGIPPSRHRPAPDRTDPALRQLEGARLTIRHADLGLQHRACELRRRNSQTTSACPKVANSRAGEPYRECGGHAALHVLRVRHIERTVKKLEISLAQRSIDRQYKPLGKNHREST